MVLLERLSSNNFENFKNLNLERFSKENYDKNFFEYYENEKFFLKIFLKKFVKLFIYGKEVIGYIWYEIPVEIPVRVWSLYIKPEYIDLLNPEILKGFNNTILSYETCNDEDTNKMLINLGFNKIKPSLLMNIKLSNYHKESQVAILKNTLEHNYNVINSLNNLYNGNIRKIKITTEKVILNKEEELRCKIQNSVFSATTRVPLEVEDIQNDIEQDYYMEDLSLFIKLNNIAIGYGQIIFNRDMYTVVNFGILKEFRGYGFGKILLNDLINRSKMMKINDLFIRVEENNYSALKLYNWIGFKPKSIINKWER
ncbi:GNAT family N-acetyltransferase [Clostridium sp. 1001271B_151109_B4]|uniref:GNAT family N-acetyltransferase n=1 Tax=Clostridium sp. 1001271B_151109_B4 TaxID=2787148 RepID=UPI0018AA3FCB|nr:GNAT family N-acetyltransferase [Clostridium sp. 1001271B_151109_B4]